MTKYLEPKEVVKFSFYSLEKDIGISKPLLLNEFFRMFSGCCEKLANDFLSFVYASRIKVRKNSK